MQGNEIYAHYHEYGFMKEIQICSQKSTQLPNRIPQLQDPKIQSGEKFDQFKKYLSKTMSKRIQEELKSLPKMKINHKDNSYIKSLPLILIWTLHHKRSKKKMNSLFKELSDGLQNQKGLENCDYWKRQLKRIEKFFELVCQGKEEHSICLWNKQVGYSKDIKDKGFKKQFKQMAAQFYKIYVHFKIITPICLVLKQMNLFEISKIEKNSPTTRSHLREFSTLQYADYILQPSTQAVKILLESLKQLPIDNEYQIQKPYLLIRRPQLNLIGKTIFYRQSNRLNEQLIATLRDKCYEKTKGIDLSEQGGEVEQINRLLDEMFKFSKTGFECEFYCAVLHRESFEQFKDSYKETWKKYKSKNKEDVLKIKKFVHSQNLDDVADLNQLIQFFDDHISRHRSQSKKQINKNQSKKKKKTQKENQIKERQKQFRNDNDDNQSIEKQNLSFNESFNPWNGSSFIEEDKPFKEYLPLQDGSSFNEEDKPFKEYPPLQDDLQSI